MENEVELLKKRFEKARWPSLVKSSRVHNVKLPDKESLWKIVLQNYENGFKCRYCRRDLVVKDSDFPYSRSFSLDHSNSLFLGGDNRLSNFVICCTACNQIKSTTSGSVYQKVIDAILEKHGRKLLDTWHKQIQMGRIANKIEREERIVEGRHW